MNKMNNYTSQTGSSTSTNTGKHLVPSGSFLKSGTKSTTPTSAQTGQNSSQPAQSYTLPTQSYTQTSQIYSQPTQSYTQTESAYTSGQAYSQSQQTYTQTSQNYTRSSQDFTQPSQDFTQSSQDFTQPSQPYAQSSQAYAQTGRVETPSARFIDSPNMFLGIIGMLLGLALATFLIVLTYSLDYFSKIQVIASCFTYVFATLGYRTLGRGIDVKGRILCSIAALIMVFFAHEIALAWHLQRAMGNGIDFATAYKSIPTVLELSSELKGWYYLELVFAYVLNIIAVIMGPDKVLKKK